MKHLLGTATLVVCTAAVAAAGAPGIAPGAIGLATLQQQIAAKPVKSTHRVMLPAAQTPAAKQSRDLDSANAASLAALTAVRNAPLTTLDPKTLAAMPCYRAIQTVDNQPSGSATLQPTQNLLVAGCFGDAPPATVTVRHDERNLSWQAAVIQRGPGYIYARMPDVTGVADGPASVTVGLADGSPSRVFRARFVAKRQTYELSPAEYGAAIRSTSGVPEVCSFQSCYWDGTMSPNDGAYWVDRSAPTLSEHRFAARTPGYQVVGYLVSLVQGSVADGGVGADGSTVVRFGTEPQPAGRHVSLLRFDRFYVDGPAGLPPK